MKVWDNCAICQAAFFGALSNLETNGSSRSLLERSFDLLCFAGGRMAQSDFETGADKSNTWIDRFRYAV